METITNSLVSKVILAGEIVENIEAALLNFKAIQMELTQ